MAVLKTPGVYVVEQNAFPNSVVEVATAVPAFVGHTEQASNQGKPLHLRPWRVSSLAEYHQYFGAGAMPFFGIAAVAAGEAPDFVADAKGYRLQQLGEKQGDPCGYSLYAAMRLFFANGGGPCYVVSVGGYTDAFDAARFCEGIAALEKEQEPTLLVVPEAMQLGSSDCTTVQQAMLRHCGETMRNRFAILDVWGGHDAAQGLAPVQQFRDQLGDAHRNYAAAYYPWLHTSIVDDKDLSYENIQPGTARSLLIQLLKAELQLPDVLDDSAAPKTRDQFKAVTNIARDFTLPVAPQTQPPKPEAVATQKADLNKTLLAISPLFGQILLLIRKQLNLLPPAAAMAGIYSMVDNSRGVWKAPANVSLNGVVAPVLSLSQEQQEALNVCPDGKSINAIRSFIGEGVLVWGGRTLDGNSIDWRYINVRRTVIMLEESCRLAAKAYVFEPNVANTWVTIKSMMQNFLTGIWKRGGLAGAAPDDAFSVLVGLGETMTAEDILEGILRVTVLVAVQRPAEFMQISFQQQMQKS